MAYFSERRRSFTYSPVARATTEGPISIIEVFKGDRITCGHIEKLALSTTADTLIVGLTSAAGGTSTSSLRASLDLSAGAVGDLLNLNATDMTAAPGFLCTGAGFVTVNYTAVGGGGTVTPKVRIVIQVVEHEHIN